MIYFWSDLHFNHDKEFIYESRGYKSILEHNEAVLERFNSVVTPEDTVYLLGDLSMGPISEDVWLPKLNGEIHFIRGNHDSNNRIKTYISLGFIDEGWATLIQRKKISLFLCHFPTLCTIGNGKLIGVHGHTHHKDFVEFNSFNVAVDALEHPISMDELIESRNLIDFDTRLEDN